MTRLDYLQDQYEDAYFALLMHEVAEQEGVRLEKLNEELQNDPAAAVPEEIDRKCLKTIDRYFAKKRHVGYWQTSKKIGARWHCGSHYHAFIYDRICTVRGIPCQHAQSFDYYRREIY